MAEIAPLDIDPDTAEMLRGIQDMSDAIAYSFAIQSMCSGRFREPVVFGIDWAKGYGVNVDNEERK